MHVCIVPQHYSSFLLRRVYKAARVTRLGGLPYLRARVTLASGLTFSLVNTLGRVNQPTRVNFLIVSRPSECNRASYPTREILLINSGYLSPTILHLVSPSVCSLHFILGMHFIPGRQSSFYTDGSG